MNLRLIASYCGRSSRHPMITPLFTFCAKNVHKVISIRFAFGFCIPNYLRKPESTSGVLHISIAIKYLTCETDFILKLYYTTTSILAKSKKLSDISTS